jgi:hexokinase
LKVLLGDEGEKRVRMGLAKDGSGVGGEFAFCDMSVAIRSESGTLTSSAALCALQAKKAIEANRIQGAKLSTGIAPPTGQTGSKPTSHPAPAK